jgi:hypothetical protein
MKLPLSEIWAVLSGYRALRIHTGDHTSSHRPKPIIYTSSSHSKPLPLVLRLESVSQPTDGSYAIDITQCCISCFTCNINTYYFAVTCGSIPLPPQPAAYYLQTYSYLAISGYHERKSINQKRYRLFQLGPTSLETLKAQK